MVKVEALVAVVVVLLAAVERLDNPAWSLKLTPGIRSRWQCDYNTLPATRICIYGVLLIIAALFVNAVWGWW